MLAVFAMASMVMAKSSVSPAKDSVLTVNIVSNDTSLGAVSGSGTYSPNDTATIQVHAAEGCRYVRMSSGYQTVPFSFPVTGNITDTAFFERIEGDTVGYLPDTGTEAGRRDLYGDTSEWGIRIPVSLRQGRQLCAVQIYCMAEGNYKLSVCLGNSPGGTTPVYSTDYYLEGEIGWRTLEFDSILTFNHLQNVWITISYVDTAGTVTPMACTDYCGNDDGSWYHYPWGWEPRSRQNDYVTWMIRVIFSPRTQLNVVASPNDIAYGDVTGMGSYYPGDLVTLYGRPKNGCYFSHWSNGRYENPMTFIITSDTALIAYFTPRTGISDSESDGVTVSLDGLSLTVDNPQGLPIDLYDIQGHRLATLHSTRSSFSFPASGVYLLRISGSPARKVVVTR